MRWTTCLLLALLAFSGVGCAGFAAGQGETMAPPPPPPPSEAERARAERLVREQQAASQREQEGAARRAALAAATRERARHQAASSAAASPRPVRKGPSPTSPPPSTPAAIAGSGGARPDTAVAAVDEVLSQLSLGHVAFNVPQRIQVDETVSIKVALSPDGGESVVLERIDEPGARISESLQVSNLMEARLSGDGFDIRPVTRERQAVGSGVTEWIWDVTPTDGGRRQLTLTIDALITVNGELAPRTLRTFRKPVEVEVALTRRVGDFASEHGKWVWTTLLVPLFGWAVRKRRDRGSAGKNAA